jgi:protein SCO1
MGEIFLDTVGALATRRLICLQCRRMAERVMNRLSNTARAAFCATLLALALPLAGCSAPANAPEQAPLAGARIGGPFTLTDMNGVATTDSRFAGKYRLIYFGYSFCPDVCPVDLNWLMLGLKQFERQDVDRAARIQPLFVTIDPERDTAEVLKGYAPQFHPRLIGLTGTVDQIAAMARAYAVTYARQPGSAPDAYLVSHSQLAYLMGPDGAPIALIPVDDIRTADVNEGSPDKVAAELARWVR